ncbi:MAG: hypothetical protein QOH17_4881, partial [Pseudonocardiales bacterium]|nr:hypothetical protein [Pseudonocardiales bacterium]
MPTKDHPEVRGRPVAFYDVKIPIGGQERRSYFSFGAASLTLGLFLAVVFWANVTSVVNPRE